MKARPSVIIIGAGPGGLAASLLLAHAGVDVRIFERLPRVGGRCSAIEEEGFRFDLGPTFFLYPPVLERIFRLVDRNLGDEVPMVRLDPQYRLIFGGGGELRCTPDVADMRTEMARFAPADAANLAGYLAANRLKMKQFTPILERAFLGWRDLLSWDLLKLLPILRPWCSVDADLRRFFSDERIRLAFSFQSKYLGMSPFNCPSLFTILSFLEYEWGVHHPIGGCAAVSEGMARIAQEMGVSISLNESVSEVLFEGKKAVGVRTDSGEHRADALIINADFAQTMRRLVPDRLRRRWTDRKIARKKYSCSTFMMYLGIDGLYEHLDHHTIYTSANYAGNLADIETNGTLSKDPSFYLQNPGITDSTLAPAGQSTLYVLAPVPNLAAGIDWKSSRAPFRALLFSQLGKLGLGDLSQRIRYEKIVTPADWQGEYEVYRGATFNLAHSLNQMLHLRPRNRFEDLDSVYLVGGGTHPGSGLPVIYESARITARLLLQDFNLDAGWLDAKPADHPAATANENGSGMKGSENQVAIIGGGLGGLAAACTLAARGYSVTLFEKSPWLGGKAAVLEEDGFRFDMGPTILTIPGVLRRIFSEAGRPLDDYLALIRLDPQWRCFFADNTSLDLVENVAAMTQRLDSFAPGSGAGYRKFQALSERLHRISNDYFFWKSIGGLRDMIEPKAGFSPKILADVLSMRMGRSVAGTVRKFVPDARVAQMLDHFTQYVGSSPKNSPAVLCSIASMQTSEGIWYPRGGTRAVPEALVKLAEELGVDLRTGIDVKRILLDEDSSVRGLETATGEEFEFGAVISNCDAVRTHRELLGGVPRFEQRRSYEPACSGVVLYLGLKKAYDHLLHHDFVFSRYPHEEFDYIYRRGEPAPDPTCYLAATSRTEPSTAPAGGEALYVLVHTPYLRPHHDWSKMLPAYRRVILEKLKTTGQMPDLEERIVFERTLTPQDIHERYRVLNGAIYGLASHGKWFGAFKPANRSPDVRGLYFAGGAAHPGPGMPMVLMSGWIAADVLDRDGVACRTKTPTNQFAEAMT